MTKKTKKIVKPVIILAVALCLAFVFTNVPQVKSFFGGIASDSSESLAATAVPASTISNVGLSSKTYHPGDVVSLGIKYNIVGNPNSTLGRFVSQSTGKKTSLIKKYLNSKTGGTVGTAYSWFAGFVNGKPIQFEIGKEVPVSGSGVDTLSYIIPSLSKLPGQIDVKTPGQASKTVYFGGILFVSGTEMDGKNEVTYKNVYAETSSDVGSRGDLVISNNVTVSVDRTNVKEGDKVKINVSKVGDFSDFTDKGISIIAADNVANSINTKGGEFIPVGADGTAIWTVPSYDKIPVSATDSSKETSKIFRIRFSTSYNEEDGHPILNAASQNIKFSAPAPTMTFTASKTTVTAGGYTNISWKTTGMQACYGSAYVNGKSVDTPFGTSIKYNLWSGAKVANKDSGIITASPTETTVYVFECVGINNVVYQADVTVTVGVSGIGFLYPHNNGGEGPQGSHNCGPATPIDNTVGKVQYLINDNSDPYCNLSSYMLTKGPMCIAFMDGGSPITISASKSPVNMSKDQNDKYTGIKIISIGACPIKDSTKTASVDTTVDNPAYGLSASSENPSVSSGSKTTVSASVLPSAPSKPVGYCTYNGSGGYTGYFAWSAPTSGPIPAKYSAIIDDLSNGFVPCSPTNTPNLGDKCLAAPAPNPYYFNGVAGHTYNAIAYSQNASGNSNWVPATATFTCK